MGTDVFILNYTEKGEKKHCMVRNKI